ncbi:hypothetical protein CspeluHIS016_0308270 [Cutaneotrichosporon spelunceum]|uniref:Uncharacterized protein n=1 Tax=Cutaneotrichosporon spelunceum TaxID=1672016 RepID=A0AAD3TU80_9TREE|nr:hypothetical protein CspeluHIS016_0308270 [Cutaneotrichosporon spelunceum]
MASHPHADEHLEPRRQVALPDSPPLTPPQFKDQFGVPVAVLSDSTLQTSQRPAPLALSGSYDRAERGPLSPQDIPHDGEHVGLGLGFSEKVSTAYMAPNRNMAGDMLRAVKGGPLSGVWLRVPRRARPILLAATSLVAIMLIFISRSVTAPPVHQYLPATGFRRNYDLYGINEEPAVVIQRPPPPPSSANALVFKTPRDELLGLIGFITAATGNSLPHSIDPSETIDMEVLVGFDPAGPGAANDLELLKDDVITQYPLVLFGRMRDPWNQELVRSLEEWSIVPAPLIVETDQRPDSAVFEPVLERLLGTNEVQLVLAGVSLGTAQDVLGLEAGELRTILEKTELVKVSPAKKKKKHAAAAEKERIHRVLRPQGMGRL